MMQVRYHRPETEGEISALKWFAVPGTVAKLDMSRLPFAVIGGTEISTRWTP